jgi:hypothetical protein
MINELTAMRGCVEMASKVSGLVDSSLIRAALESMQVAWWVGLSQRFVRTLQQDSRAVRWRHRFVEQQTRRRTSQPAQTLKRETYGRASVQLLRARALSLSVSQHEVVSGNMSEGENLEVQRRARANQRTERQEY